MVQLLFKINNHFCPFFNSSEFVFWQKFHQSPCQYLISRNFDFNCLAIYLAVCAGLNSSLEMDLPTVFQAYWARPTFEFRILVNNSWTISYICSKRLANNTYFWYYNQTIKKTVKIKLSKNQNNLLNGNSELVLGS